MRVDIVGAVVGDVVEGCSEGAVDVVADLAEVRIAVDFEAVEPSLGAVKEALTADIENLGIQDSSD